MTRLLPACLCFAVLVSGSLPALAQDASPPEIVAEVRELVEDRFYDPEALDGSWRAAADAAEETVSAESGAAALDSAVDTMLSSLGVSHTMRYTPDEAAYYELLGIFSRSRDVRRRIEAIFPDEEVEYAGIGIVVRRAGGRMFVDGVHHGSAADQAGILRGDEIVSVDGAPFAEIASFEDMGTPVTLSLRRDEGGPLRDIEVTPRTIRPNEAFGEALSDSMRIVEAGNSRIGYARVWSYARESYHRTLAEALWRGPLSEADGLILDLRGGWGGAEADYAELFLGGAPLMTMTDRDGEEQLASFVWDRPVVALIDGGTRSGKEVIAYALQRGGVPLVGARTAGALLAGQAFMLADDSLLILAVLDVEVEGRRLEGVGVAPDIAVPFDIPYAAGADPQMQAALERMRLSLEAGAGEPGAAPRDTPALP